MIDFNNAVLERSRTVPVVVDFWAEWCGPCHVLGPIVEALAEKADGRWELVKVDLEAQPELAQEHGVMSIPTLKIYHGGKAVAEMIGAQPEPDVRRWLDGNVPGPVRDS
jgi:putative thioredoxin